MAHFGLQQMKIVSQGRCLQLRAGSGIELGIRSAHATQHIVHIFHQFQGFLRSHVIMQVAAELGGDIVFSVGKGACASIAVHDVAWGTFETRLGAFLNRALAFFQGRPLVNHKYVCLVVSLCQLVR